MYKRITQITDGVKNTVSPSKNIEALAAKRISICRICPQFRKDPNVKGAKGDYCNECGCDLYTKTRSTQATCPLKKW